jgi:hypothetical protein
VLRLLKSALMVGAATVLVSTGQAQDLRGKWSDSPDKQTCEIPVGSSPDVAMVYRISPRSVVYYEIECAVQDVKRGADRISMNVDCLKGAGARWFERLSLRPLGPDKLQLTSSNRKPPRQGTAQDSAILYRCPPERLESPKVPSQRVSKWRHGGSTMSISETNESIEINYLQPRKGMTRAGVRPQTMLFFGSRNGTRVEGTAYIFDSRCGPVPYSVEGQYSGNARQLSLSGQSPRVNAACQATGSVAETLRFERTP